MLFLDCPDGLGPFVSLVKNGIMPLIQIGVPIILVVLGSLDLGKAVIAGKEDEMKSAQKMLIRRCIYAVLVFFIVMIVNLALSLVSYANDDDATGATSNWTSCWNSV